MSRLFNEKVISAVIALIVAIAATYGLNLS